MPGRYNLAADRVALEQIYDPMFKQKKSGKTCQTIVWHSYCHHIGPRPQLAWVTALKIMA